MEKQKDQEFAHLEVKRLCGVFGAPLPPVEEKPVDKVENIDKTRINALEKELAETKAQAAQYKQESDEYAEKIEFANADRDLAKDFLKDAQDQVENLKKEIAAVTAESATYSKLLHELLDKLMQK